METTLGKVALEPNEPVREAVTLDVLLSRAGELPLG